MDAHKVGSAGEKQHGIDIIVRMETGARWVIQCKRVEKFREADFTKAIAKAETEFKRYSPDRYLLWVTGQVNAGATLLADSSEIHPHWSLWNAERLTNEFIQHTPPRQCFTILQQCFDHGWAKAFFPIPDDLLICAEAFFQRWDGPDRLFHHHAELMGRESDLADLSNFARGGIGTKALILSARGGVGKSRLLKAAATQAADDSPERSVLFLNPNASPDADLPRCEDLTKLTIIHDDAHRHDFPGLLLTMMASEKSAGSRLILSTRPGAEDSLCETLMNAGYQAKDITTKELKALSKPAMVKLAASLMGDVDEDSPRVLSELSGGCALITVVGAELIREGELTGLDLQRSEHFALEVFARFEGQELDRASGSLDRPILEKLLRSIALLSPWQSKEANASERMAEFLGVPRGLLESAIDSLCQCGLLVINREGIRVTPDLFSDHLVYDSCYGEKGQVTDFIANFLETFGNRSTVSILRNLAEAQWRAIELHGEAAVCVIAPLWNRVLKEFEVSTFWERSRLLEKWKEFAIYLPRESIELAAWAMDLKSAPLLPGYGTLNTHDRVLSWLPHVLKPIAIWSDKYRSQSLDLLWRLEHEFPTRESAAQHAYQAFAEIASFRFNFPQAPSGVLDWLEKKLASEDGENIADSPCGLLNMSLRPFFARTVEVSYWQDRRTCVFGHREVSIAKTKALRRRALALINEQIIPRGTVAAVNVLPVLGHAIRSDTVGYDSLDPALARRWLPDRKLALKAIEEAARRHRNHWVHFVVRNQVSWHIVYGKDERWRKHCLAIVSSLLDTFEMRLARLTLSSSYGDSLDRYRGSGHYEKKKADWGELFRRAAKEFLAEYIHARSAKQCIEDWSADAAKHGFEVKLGEFCSELARQDQGFALLLLDAVMEDRKSCLNGFAATLLHPEGCDSTDAIEARIRQGLRSVNETIVQSFWNVLQYSPWLQTDTNVSAMLELAKTSEGSVLSFLISRAESLIECPWTDALIRILVRRNLNAEQTLHLANAMAKHERYGGEVIHEENIDALMDRLALLPSLPIGGQSGGYLQWLAEKHPTKLYQLFINRIDASENGIVLSPGPFEPMSFYDGLALRGLAELPEFANIAQGLLDAIFNRLPAARSPWSALFIAVVARTSPIVEPLLTGRLLRIDTKADLCDLVSLMRFKGSVLAYRYPRLVDGILKKARSFGPATLEEVTWDLIHSSRPSMRAYANGVLDDEYCYALIEAEKAYAQHADHPVLGPFYLKIVELEKADAEQHKRMAEASFESDW